MTIQDKIRDLLNKTLDIHFLKIIDDTSLHKGHLEAKKNKGGHFKLQIVSKDFQGRSPLERHQMVYKALAELMDVEIHALAIQTYLPES